MASSVALAAILVIGATAQAEHHKKDIVDTAVAAEFNTLVKAVQAADLVDALKGEVPLTVFAPTDEAFANVPAETMEALLRPENKEQLTAVLTYHVVAGKVMAADVVKMKSAETLNGEKARIRVNNGTVMIDGAKVAKTDIAASNGVIHVIDTVILPKNLGELSD
ncbi:MAG: fasciclin domain-containing protein [Acidobacteria bacterium]|nr:fasciclin domain-containing protein [Acidobacteriota bacterium]